MMLSKSRLLLIAGFLLGLSILNPASLYADSPIWAPEPLNRIIEEGLSHNREIVSMQSLIHSMEEEAGFASSLPDPMIGVGILNLPVDSFRLDQEPMTQKQLFVSQKFPWFGKRDLQGEQAMLKAERLKALLQAKQLEISRGLAEHYYDLAFVIYSLRINRQLQEILNQSIQIAETRYAAGRGMQPDIFQGQIELSRLQNEHNSLEKMQQVLGSRMLALMNKERSDMMDQLTVIDGYPQFPLDSNKIHQLAFDHNPMLKAKEAEILLSESGVELARKDSYPDVEVRLAYGQRDESRTGIDWADFFSASVSMNIPLWQHSRQDKKVSSSLAAKQSIEESYQNLYAMLPHRLDVIISELENNRKNYDLYQEKLIPQTREWEQSAVSAYEVGKIDFSTMIDARMRVLRSQLEARKLVFDALKNRAALEEMVGLSISDLDQQLEGGASHE